MKKLLVLLTVCCMCTACGTKEEPVVVPENTEVVEETVETTEETVETTEETVETTEETVEETVETTEETETTVEETDNAVEVKVVSPLPTTIDMSALDNCTLAVSFDKEDVFVDENGIMQLKADVYTYDLYDMVDISTLAIGDTITIQNQDVVVESMETLESGLLFINGGMENGGYDLWHNESGVYFEHGYNDTKSYYSLGEATFRVSDEFEFIDSSDLEKEPVTYFSGDLLLEETEFIFGFNPNNTSIVIENGVVTQMTRIYTP